MSSTTKTPKGDMFKIFVPIVIAVLAALVSYIFIKLDKQVNRLESDVREINTFLGTTATTTDLRQLEERCCNRNPPGPEPSVPSCTFQVEGDRLPVVPGANQIQGEINIPGGRSASDYIFFAAVLGSDHHFYIQRKVQIPLGGGNFTHTWFVDEAGKPDTIMNNTVYLLFVERPQQPLRNNSRIPSEELPEYVKTACGMPVRLR